MKDKNLLAVSATKKWLKFRKTDRIEILNTMKIDLELLEKFNLMDYSLLLCISENANFNSKVPLVKSRLSVGVRKELENDFTRIKTRYTFLSKCCRYIYHMGIIDYL